VIQPRDVLILTSVPALRGDLADALRIAGYSVEVVEALQGAISPDLSVVDLSTGDYWQVVEPLSSGRLVLLVADTESMRRGFTLGADDCVLSSAHVDEMVARCEAILRRTSSPDSSPESPEPALYADRRLWINFGLRQVWAGGKSAQLTPREHRLLQYFVRNSDRTLSHDQILGEVWGRSPKSDRPTEVLKQYIWRLRQKVEADPDDPEIIVTVLGEGYRFVSHL
jgi:two-component system KDP operon response regulator KdpE